MVDLILALSEPMPGAGDPKIDRRRKDRDMTEILRRLQGDPTPTQDLKRRPQRTPGQVGINPAPEVYLPEIMEPHGGAPWPNADFEPPPPPDDLSKYPRFPYRPPQRRPP